MLGYENLFSNIVILCHIASKLVEDFNRDEILRKVIFFSQAVGKASIKLKEISYIQCEGLVAGELKRANDCID